MCGMRNLGLLFRSIQETPDRLNRELPFAFQDDVAATGNDGQLCVWEQMEDFHELVGPVIGIVVARNQQRGSFDRSCSSVTFTGPIHILVSL
jgi:hypothetical protein